MRMKLRSISLRFTWALTALVCHSSLALAEDAAPITKGPYLQSPTQHSITIMWECGSPEGGVVADAMPDDVTVSFKPTDRVQGQVWYGRDESLKGATTAEAEIVEVRYRGKPDDGNETGTAKAAYLFTCRLEGLEPGQKYYYQAGAGNEKSAVHSFRTVPRKADTFTFVAYTDSHGGKPTVHARICDLIAKEKPDFVLHTGDLVDCGKNYWEWGEAFFTPAARLLDRVPLWPSIGNHDGIGTREPYWQLFSLPGKERYYSFDYGNAHFVSLDSFASRDEEMLKWCEQDLANSKAVWKVVFLHLPAFGVGRYPCKWGWRSYIRMFEKHRVSLYLCGHLHIYQRLHPLYMPGGLAESAITYVINSGTGGKLRVPGSHPTVASAASKAQYLAIKVDGLKMTAHAVDIEGEVIDRFSIERKPDGSYDEKVVASAMDARSVMVKDIFPKGYVADIPTQEKPAEVFFHISAAGLGLKEKIELRVSLEEESQKHYVLQPEPIKVTMDPEKACPLRIKVLAREGVNVTLNGRWFAPLLQVKFDYATSYIKGSAVSRVSYTEKRWW